jgi:hypothetical protein
MTTRRKYWLHISSTNQATSQVNTAASPQTARNFGLADRTAAPSQGARRPGVIGGAGRLWGALPPTILRPPADTRAYYVRTGAHTGA